MLSRSRNAGLLCKIIVAQEQRPGVAVEITGLAQRFLQEFQQPLYGKTNKQTKKYFSGIYQKIQVFFFHILEHNPTYRIHIFANFSDMSIANFSHCDFS